MYAIIPITNPPQEVLGLNSTELGFSGRFTEVSNLMGTRNSKEPASQSTPVLLSLLLWDKWLRSGGQPPFTRSLSILRVEESYTSPPGEYCGLVGMKLEQRLGSSQDELRDKTPWDFFFSTLFFKLIVCVCLRVPACNQWELGLSLSNTWALGVKLRLSGTVSTAFTLRVISAALEFSSWWKLYPLPKIHLDDDEGWAHSTYCGPFGLLNSLFKISHAFILP